MQKNTYRSPQDNVPKVTPRVVGQPRVATSDDSVLRFNRVSSARHLNIREWMAELCQKPPP